MRTIDLRKELREFYNVSRAKVTLVNVPSMNFLMVDGTGTPEGSSAFQEAIQALYSLAYTLKFMIKLGPAQTDYPVMPLEGLWWMKGNRKFDAERKDLWRWTLMIVQPKVVTAARFAAAREQLREKKNPPGLDQVRLERFREGRAVQTLHVGPYSDEAPTIERLHAFAKENGYRIHGKHHEIYRSDPRRTPPERLKTILRHPVKR